MAIAAVVVKMRCVAIQNGGPGPLDERVDLEQVLDNDTAKSSVTTMPVAKPKPATRMTLYIDTVAAKGQFKKDQLYVMSFAETT